VVKKEEKPRSIGLHVKPPAESCTDRNCPFHGSLPVRGQILTGVVSATKMQNTIRVERRYMHYVPKYERYEKRTSTYSAHCSPCIKVKVGDMVRIGECKPLSKTVSFVTIEKL
jgi:small subunit ribosomal protein S17